MSDDFLPADSITDRHGCFVALVGGTNSGKTFSAMRLARGIAGPEGKIAVLDTEGGRTLHLKQDFAFDVRVLEPPHRPERYLEAARRAQAAGYACLVIDSFTAAWRGVGGVLDWTDEELEVAVERARANAEEKGWNFNEARTRASNKMAASIRPKMAWKLMVSGFLGLRIPIVFSIRGENTLDPDTKKEVFKAQVQRSFLFEVTVSFRLSSDKKGVIDLSDANSWKMEKAHQPIFRNGDLLSEQHGAALAAWARGEGAAPAAPPATAPKSRTKGEVWADEIVAAFERCTSAQEVMQTIDRARQRLDALVQSDEASWRRADAARAAAYQRHVQPLPDGAAA